MNESVAVEGSQAISVRKPYRLMLHCKPPDVTQQLVTDRLREELGNSVELKGYTVEPEIYYMEVKVGSGVRNVPVSLVALHYSGSIDYDS